MTIIVGPDVPSEVLHANLPDLETSGHPADVIDGLTAAIESVVDPAVADEAAAREAGDDANAAAITAEASARVSGDATNATAITNEATARATGDATNATAITNEASARVAADDALNDAITAEVLDRIAADDALGDALALEVANRIAADALLVPRPASTAPSDVGKVLGLLDDDPFTTGWVDAPSGGGWPLTADVSADGWGILDLDRLGFTDAPDITAVASDPWWTEPGFLVESETAFARTELALAAGVGAAFTYVLHPGTNGSDLALGSYDGSQRVEMGTGSTSGYFSVTGADNSRVAVDARTGQAPRLEFRDDASNTAHLNALSDGSTWRVPVRDASNAEVGGLYGLATGPALYGSPSNALELGQTSPYLYLKDEASDTFAQVYTDATTSLIEGAGAAGVDAWMLGTAAFKMFGATGIDGTATPVSITALADVLVDAGMIASHTIPNPTVVPFTPASSSGPAALDFAEDTDNGASKIVLSGQAALAADVAVALPAIAGTLLSRTDDVGTSLGTTGTVNLDMAALTGTAQLISPSGNITFTTSNGASGRHVRIMIANGLTARTLTLPSWIPMNRQALPTRIAALQWVVIDVYFTSTGDSSAHCYWWASKATISGTSGSIALNFAALDQSVQLIEATGDITFTTQDLAPFREVRIFIDANGATRTITYPSWVAQGAALVTSIPAGKRLALSLMSLGTTDVDVSAATALQP